MKRYGVEYRTIFNKEKDSIRHVYSPVIYKKDGDKIFASRGEEVVEVGSRQEALDIAEDVYYRLLKKDTDWIVK